MVSDQCVNHTWKNLKSGLEEKIQKRKPSRTNGGFVNDVLSSWEEMKIEHIQNAIDIQKEVMLEIIERQGGQLCFSAQILRANRENYMSLCHEGYTATVISKNMNSTFFNHYMSFFETVHFGFRVQ